MKHQPAGYEALIKRYDLDVIPHWHRSFVALQKQTHHLEKEPDGTVYEIYPAKYKTGDSVGEQLEFALKYDGVNLGILAKVFQRSDTEELLNYLRSKPTGKYARRIWFFYEYITGEMLPLEDMKQGNYVDLLEDEDYYTVSKGDAVKRQRIRNNLLGTETFSPIVRKTELLKKMEAENLTQSCEKLLSDYPQDLLKRALSYLYTKETKSSFAIEHEAPSSTRTERFIALLQEAEKEEFCTKERLIELQNRIVDPRFADEDYRVSQNYVGESMGFGREKIHYISPKPEDIEAFMDGLVATHQRMHKGDVHPVVHAAIIAYGFVFLHPFEDGNGRIHRFLIHNILARKGFTPAGIMFPVSAAMLKEPAVYDGSLEEFSSKIVPMVEYDLDEDGKMLVHNDTRDWYRFIDMTHQVEALYGFIVQTIEKELPQELVFIAGYDVAKKAIREIVDMPDRLIDLYIRFALQNQGKLSKNKREKYFDRLSDKELEQIEKSIAEAFSV